MWPHSTTFLHGLHQKCVELETDVTIFKTVVGATSRELSFVSKAFASDTRHTLFEANHVQ